MMREVLQVDCHLSRTDDPEVLLLQMERQAWVAVRAGERFQVKHEQWKLDLARNRLRALAIWRMRQQIIGPHPHSVRARPKRRAVKTGRRAASPLSLLTSR
jgi:hypothetical protein